MKLTNEHLLKLLREGNIRLFINSIIVATSAGTLRWIKRTSKRDEERYVAPNFELITRKGVHKFSAMSDDSLEMKDIVLRQEYLSSLKNVIDKNVLGENCHNKEASDGNNVDSAKCSGGE